MSRRRILGRLTLLDTDNLRHNAESYSCRQSNCWLEFAITWMQSVRLLVCFESIPIHSRLHQSRQVLPCELSTQYVSTKMSCGLISAAAAAESAMWCVHRGQTSRTPGVKHVGCRSVASGLLSQPAVQHKHHKTEKLRLDCCAVSCSYTSNVQCFASTKVLGRYEASVPGAVLYCSTV